MRELLIPGLALVFLTSCDELSNERQERAPAIGVPPKVSKAPLQLSARVLKRACADICEKTRPLNCGPVALCQQTCLGSFGLPVCPREMEKFLSCTHRTSVESFECDETGTAILKGAACDAEQGRLVACLNSGKQ